MSIGHFSEKVSNLLFLVEIYIAISSLALRQFNGTLVQGVFQSS